MSSLILCDLPNNGILTAVQKRIMVRRATKSPICSLPVSIPWAESWRVVVSFSQKEAPVYICDYDTSPPGRLFSVLLPKSTNAWYSSPLFHHSDDQRVQFDDENVLVRILGRLKWKEEERVKQATRFETHQPRLSSHAFWHSFPLGQDWWKKT